jgi:hypothetical protein
VEQEEWEALLAIREEMNANLMAQGSEVQEKYVELLVKSLEGKGDMPIGAVSRTSKDGSPPLPGRRNAL